MPKVHASHDTFEIDDTLYERFLQEMIQEDMTLDEACGRLEDDDAIALSNYVKYRLAEVDSGYAP